MKTNQIASLSLLLLTTSLVSSAALAAASSASYQERAKAAFGECSNIDPTAAFISSGREIPDAAPLASNSKILSTSQGTFLINDTMDLIYKAGIGPDLLINEEAMTELDAQLGILTNGMYGEDQPAQITAENKNWYLKNCTIVGPQFEAALKALKTK